MPWQTIAELSTGALAGALGTIVRMANPQRRRLGLCVLWELPSGLGFGMAAYGLAPLFGIEEGAAKFAIAYGCGYLGQAAVHDSIHAFLMTRMRLSQEDAIELQKRRAADHQVASPTSNQQKDNPHE